MNPALLIRMILIVGGGASLTAAQQDPELRLRGRRIETRDSIRQTEVVLEGLDDRHRARTVGDVHMEIGSGREVDLEDLHERQQLVFSGGRVGGRRTTSRDRGTDVADEKSGSKSPPTAPNKEGSGSGISSMTAILAAILGLILWSRWRRSLKRGTGYAPADSL